MLGSRGLTRSSRCWSVASPTPFSSTPTGLCWSSRRLKWRTSVPPTGAEQVPPRGILTTALAPDHYLANARSGDSSETGGNNERGVLWTTGGGARPRSQPPSCIDHHRCVAAGDVPGSSGSDDRLNRAADDRRRPARRVAPRLGGRCLPARCDRLHTALGQARRPVRTQVVLPSSDHHLPCAARPSPGSAAR